MKLSKQRAYRCGTCDIPWNQCLDRSYVHGKPAARRVDWNYTGWEEEDQSWNQSTQSRKQTKSPRGKKGKSPRRPKKQADATDPPAYDPPWSTKTSHQTPQASHGAEASSSNGQAEQQLQSLVGRLKEKDTALSPEEIQQIIEETTVPEVTSKTMHQAVKKLDQTRSKFQAAQKERSNLHKKWTSYIEESIKRWKTLVDDFSAKDTALEEKVSQARGMMQQAKASLDKIKELHSKQDDAFLGEVTEIASDGEEDMKIEASEAIQQGLAKMVTSLESIRIRSEPNAEDAQVAKKPRTEDAGHGSKALQPFGGPNK